MEPRISLVTLGVTDLERSLRFYRDGLGWRPSSASVEGDVAFFQVGPLVLALWSRSELARMPGCSTAVAGAGSRSPTTSVRRRRPIPRWLAPSRLAGGCSRPRPD